MQIPLKDCARGEGEEVRDRVERGVDSCWSNLSIQREYESVCLSVCLSVRTTLEPVFELLMISFV